MTAHDIAAQLPSIDELRTRCQALAVLNHLVGGKGADQYFSCTTSSGLGDQVVLMRNGGGNEWAVVFTAAGAFIRMFDHESDMSPYAHGDLKLWPGLVDGLPDAFRPLLEAPEFTDDGSFIATAVLWRLTGDDRWRASTAIEFPPLQGPYDIDDGSIMLEILLDGTVDRFVAFAGHFYGREIDRAPVEHVVAHRPLTAEVVQALNPEFSITGLDAVLTDIGYPVR